MWCLLKFPLDIGQMCWIFFIVFCALDVYLVENILQCKSKFHKTNSSNNGSFDVQWFVELLFRNILYATSDGTNAVSSTPLVSNVFLPSNSLLFLLNVMNSKLLRKNFDMMIWRLPFNWRNSITKFLCFYFYFIMFNVSGILFFT